MLAELLSTSEEYDAISQQILDAALAEFTEFGFRRVTIADVARRTGLHRATVHRRFPTKDDLVTAASIVWARRFFNGIIAAVEGLENAQDQIVEAFTLTYNGFRTDPLVNRILTTDADTVLPFVTTRGGLLISAVTELFADQFRANGLDIPDIDVAAELMARIGLSLVLTPGSRAQLRTDDEIRAFARRYLLSLI